MPIYQLAHYQVRAEAVAQVKQAIDEFVTYIQASERGTQVYLAWQQEADPTRFTHVFIFEDEAAQSAHSESEAGRRFEAADSPHLVGGPVQFVDYDWVAGKR